MTDNTEPARGFYTHYKNPDKLYFVFGCATNWTTNQREVVYLACYENEQRLHTRDLEEWNMDVWIRKENPEGGDYVSRFTRVPTPEMFWTDYLGDALGEVMGEFLL